MGQTKLGRYCEQAKANTGPTPSRAATFAKTKRKKLATGTDPYIGRSIKGEYGGVNLSNPSYVKYYKGMI